MSNEPVHAVFLVEYGSTTITKRVKITGNETDAVKVNRALEHLTKKIQLMVQSDQGVKS